MIHHTGKHLHFHLTRLSELKRLYWAHSVHALASSMTTIFVPIYLYKLGYGITAIMAYYLLVFVFQAVALYPLMKFSNRIGFNRSMGMALLLYGVYILVLATIPNFGWPLWLAGIIWATSISLYWAQFRACFAHSLLHKKNVGTAVGLSAALTLMAYGIAPAIGGAVATYFGIVVLYIIAMGCLVAAALPLFSGPEIIRHKSFRLRDINLRRIWPDLFANAGGEIDDVVMVIVWPLFIFLLIPTYIGVGVLSSVTVMASIAIALYTGRHLAKKGTGGYLKTGTTTLGITSALRLVSSSASQIAGVNFLSGLGHALTETPFHSRYYLNAEREPSLPYVFYMILISAIADILLFGILLIISLFAPIKIVLIVGLIFAVPAGLIMRYIRP